MVSYSSSLHTGTVAFLFTNFEGSNKLLRQRGDYSVSVLADQRRRVRMSFRTELYLSTHGFCHLVWEAFERHRGEMDQHDDAILIAIRMKLDA